MSEIKLFKNLYILGDSHVNIYRISNINKYFNCSIHHTDCEYSSRIGQFKPFLMNTITNKGKEFLSCYINNIKNSFIMFIFGEPDVRIHIHKQINLYNRNEEEIIDTLSKNYVNFIIEICKLCDSTPIIRYILPPVDKDFWEIEIFKANGTIDERVRYTNKLNDKIKHYCYINNVLFFENINKTLLTNENGSLKEEYIIGQTHYNENSIELINQEILYFLEKSLI